jgi:hypothetical protein
MKTDELIAALASGAGPARRLVMGRDVALVLFAGLVLCSIISLGVRGLVPPPMWVGAALWTKIAYSLALTASAVWLLQQFAFPARRTGLATRAVALVLLSMAVIGAFAVLNVPAGGRLPYVMGKTALICPWAIALLSLPTLGCLFWLTRRLAPTDLRSTGLTIGLLSGSIAALGYALSCGEQAIGFIAIWYSAGILLSGGIGAALGPRLLRW